MLNILQCTAQDPAIRNYLTPNVSSVEVEKTWFCGKDRQFSALCGEGC